MDLSELTPRRQESRIIDHLLLWGSWAFTLGVFAVADDRWRGSARVTDGLAFSLVFVATGYVQAWLPQIWRQTDRTPLAGFVTPLFMTLVLAYLYFAFRAAFVQPAATATAVLAQLVSLIVLSLRSQ